MKNGRYAPVLVRLLAGGLLGALLAPAVVYLIGPVWVAAETGAAAEVGAAGKDYSCEFRYSTAAVAAIAPSLAAVTS